MKKIIEKMIEYAEMNHDCEVADMVNDLLLEFAYTCNCPLNWTNLGEELLKENKDNEWIVENCKLYNFE